MKINVNDALRKGGCEYLQEPCDAEATKSVQMFMIALSGVDKAAWRTLHLCDEHYEAYAVLADEVPGLMVRF